MLNLLIFVVNYFCLKNKIIFILVPNIFLCLHKGFFAYIVLLAPFFIPTRQMQYHCWLRPLANAYFQLFCQMFWPCHFNLFGTFVSVLGPFSIILNWLSAYFLQLFSSKSFYLNIKLRHTICYLVIQVSKWYYLQNDLK